MFTRTRRVFAIVLIALLSSSSVFAQIADTVRFGAISIAYVARNSNAGKAALAQIEALGRKKSIEVEARAAELQKQQVELQKQGSVMSPRAITDLQRAFDKSRLEFDRFQQDAQAEVEAMQSKFEAEFRIKLAPIVDEISKEKGLHLVFGLEQAAIVWWSPAVDISGEVVKRLDALKAP